MSSIFGEKDIQNLDYEDVKSIYDKYIKLRSEGFLNIENSEKINLLYSNNKEQFARVMLNSILNVKTKNVESYTPSDEDIEQYVPVFSNLLDGIFEEQGGKFCSLLPISEGFYSSIFQIGGKILKLGAPRRTYEMPNHRRILQPFIRENFETQTGEPFACVEVSEAVSVPKILNYNVLYDIYKELRQDGILWADAKTENIGILNETNLPQYNNEYFENNPEFVGLKGNVSKDEILDSGEYVIIDTDFLYALDPNAKVPKNSDMILINRSEEFESRYQMDLEFKRRAEMMNKNNDAR